MYVCMYVCMYIYIYIYIYRAGESEVLDGALKLLQRLLCDHGESLAPVLQDCLNNIAQGVFFPSPYYFHYYCYYYYYYSY